MLPPGPTTIEQVCVLDTQIGQRFAQVAQELSEQAFAGGVELVCSHGQTVFHWVAGNHALGTLQLGQPAFIAERTGATVVGDVRARDIAAGGHGAPLASLLDVLLLERRHRRRARHRSTSAGSRTSRSSPPDASRSRSTQDRPTR